MDHLTTEPIESKSGIGPNHCDAATPFGPFGFSSDNMDTFLTQKANPSGRETAGTDTSSQPEWPGLELRVTRAGMPARRLRINSPRCTFGSGEGCTVRLSDASLRPLHAVILCDNGRIMIRGYSVPLEINGVSVTESYLSLGDVIRLGQYCLEMIDMPAADPSAEYGLSQSIAHSVDAKPSASKPVIAAAQDTPEESDDDQTSPLPKRLRFSPALTTDILGSNITGDRAILDAMVHGQVSDETAMGFDAPVTTRPVIRESATSLAQIHVQAKRNSELTAELADLRRKQQKTTEQLDATTAKLKASEEELDEANVSLAALHAEVTSLLKQIQAVTNQSLKQQAVAETENAKLNRTIASMRESLDASQAAEAATRQSLQESFRQRDEAFAQRASAIDAHQKTQAKLEEANAHIARLTQQAVAVSSLLSERDSEVQSAKARIDELKDICCGQAEQISRLSAEIESRQKSELATVAKQNETIKLLRKELANAQALLETAELERVNIESRQAEFEATQQNYLKEKLAWDSMSDCLNKQLDTLSAELQLTKQALTQATDDSAIYQAQLSDLRSQLDDLNAHAAQADSSLALRPTIEQVEDLQQQLAETEIDLENNKRQLAQLRADYDRLASDKIAYRPTDSAPAIQPQSGNSLVESTDKSELPIDSTQRIESIDPHGSTPFFASPHFGELSKSDDNPAPADQDVAKSQWHKPSYVSDGAAVSDNPPTSESSWQRSYSVPTPETSREMNVGHPVVNDSEPSSIHSAPENQDADYSPTVQFADPVLSPNAYDLSGNTGDGLPLNEDNRHDEDPEYFRPSATKQGEQSEESLESWQEGQLASQSSWFADYLATQRSKTESANVQVTAEAEDNLEVLERLNQMVRDDSEQVSIVDSRLAVSEHEELDPETTALSLARMLINELDIATESSSDSVAGPLSSSPDPLVESKRLASVAMAEEGVVAEAWPSEEQPPAQEARGRYKEFDERAFRVAFANSVKDGSADLVASPESSEESNSTGVVHEANAASDSSIGSESVDDADSVEAYMNQLLRRMGQEPSIPTAAKKDPEPIIRPKRLAPELEVPLDQMRELANQSAESAISASDRKGLKLLRKKAIVDGVQAVVVVICGLVFFYCGTTSPNLKLVWFTAGGLAIALSGFFFYEMFRKLKLSMQAG